MNRQSDESLEHFSDQTIKLFIATATYQLIDGRWAVLNPQRKGRYKDSSLSL